MGRRILESLVDFDPRTLKLYGVLAERWDVSDDQKVVTYYLRKNARWHDGEAFDADDVIFSWEALQNPSYTTSKVRTSFRDAEKLEKVDQYTVRMTWKKVYFNAVGVMNGLPIMPKHVFEKDKTDFNKHPYHRAPVGTGSYVFSEWKTGNYIELKRNKDYWGKDLKDPPFAYPKPSIDTLKYIVIKEQEVQLQAFKRGDLDYTSLTPDQFFANEELFRADPTVGISRYSLPAYSYAVWNGRKPLFKDKRVREALSYALNRDEIIDQVYRGVGTRITGPFLPEADSYDRSLTARPPSTSRKRLTCSKRLAGRSTQRASSSTTRAKPSPSPSVSHPAAKRTQIATIFKKDLSRLGVDMKIRTTEWATFLKSLNDHDFDVATLGWRLGEVTDPFGLWHLSEAKTGSELPRHEERPYGRAGGDHPRDHGRRQARRAVPRSAQDRLRRAALHLHLAALGDRCLPEVPEELSAAADHDGQRPARLVD